jgi:hypothetical protein
MVVIKKIKLNLVEKYLEDVVVSSSQIKVSQEELKYVKTRMENNKREFSAGDISDNLFKSKKISLEKEKKKLDDKIKANIKNSLKRLQDIRNILNKIEI